MSDQKQFLEKVIQLLSRNETPGEDLLQHLSADERALIEELQKDGLLTNAALLLQKLNADKVWNKVKPALQPQIISLRLRLLKYAAILILPLLVAGGAYVYIKSNAPVSLNMAVLKPTDHQQATLVLANGAEVLLAKNADKQIAEANGTSIINHKKELLSYQQNKDQQAALAFNKIIVPRGGEYKLALSDGTEIMVNSASVLRFPVNANAGSTRDVYLEKGEAYFHVAKNPSKPFIVHANGMDVKVLGTTFNVNTYTKNTMTTLVEGKVEATGKNNAKVILAPNQQAIFNTQTSELNKLDVDINPYTAWAHGKIVFEEATLDEVMQALSLWYDYDVEFKSDKIKQVHFSGEIEKYKDIKTVLNIIEQTGGVKFSCKDRRIYVDQH